MATIKPPKKAKGKGTPPQLEETKNNLAKVAANDYVGLRFSVSPEFRKEYKTFALDNDMTMVEVLQKSFELLKEKMG